MAESKKQVRLRHDGGGADLMFRDSDGTRRKILRGQVFETDEQTAEALIASDPGIVKVDAKATDVVPADQMAIQEPAPHPSSSEAEPGAIVAPTGGTVSGLTYSTGHGPGAPDVPGVAPAPQVTGSLGVGDMPAGGILGATTPGVGATTGAPGAPAQTPQQAAAASPASGTADTSSGTADTSSSSSSRSSRSRRSTRKRASK